MKIFAQVDTGETRVNADDVSVPIIESARYGETAYGITSDMILQFVAVFFYFMIGGNKANAEKVIPAWIFVWFSIMATFWISGSSGSSTLIPSRSFGNFSNWSDVISVYLNCFIGAFFGSRVGKYLFE